MLQRPKTFRRRRRRAFTFVEVLIAVVLIALVVAPSILSIEATRMQARSTTYSIIGQNLATSMMELVKRSGYNEIAYSQPLPAILGSASSVSSLLELPRQSGSSSGATATTLPAGAPGGVTNATMDTFLGNWRAGTMDRTSGVITASTNYLYFSNDQIAAISGYTNAAAVPVGSTTMNAQYAWAIYVNTDTAGASGGAIGFPLKHVAIVVKWRDIRRNSVQYCVIESYVSQVGPRL